MSVQTKITLEGNFFTRSPGKTLRQNVRKLMDGLGEWMGEQVEEEVRSHAGSMPFYTGWTADHIVGRSESLAGKDWGTWAVVSANTSGMSAADATRTLAAASTIERRWHIFRRVKSAVYRARPLLSANLTKGLE